MSKASELEKLEVRGCCYRPYRGNTMNQQTDRSSAMNLCEYEQVISPTFLKLTPFHSLKQVAMLITFSKYGRSYLQSPWHKVCHTVGPHYMLHPFWQMFSWGIEHLSEHCNFCKHHISGLTVGCYYQVNSRSLRSPPSVICVHAGSCTEEGDFTYLAHHCIPSAEVVPATKC